MGGMTRNYQVGDEVTSLVKQVTQEAINLFESSSGETGPSQFTDEETAREILGTSGTVASGRMSLTFALEMLRRAFGADVFNHTGSVDLRFLRPVRPGDTITGRVEVLEGRSDKPITTLRTSVTRDDRTVVLEGDADCYTMPLA